MDAEPQEIEVVTDELPAGLLERLGLAVGERVVLSVWAAPAKSVDTSRIREIRARWAALPTLDDRDHADMLYDEDGLPK